MPNVASETSFQIERFSKILKSKLENYFELNE